MLSVCVVGHYNTPGQRGVPGIEGDKGPPGLSGIPGRKGDATRTF